MKLGVVISALLGLAISSGSPVGLSASILAPVIWLRQNSRMSSWVSAMAYYVVALRDLTVVSRNFFGPEGGPFEGLILWLVGACLLSVPWLWAWSLSRTAAFWRCPIALLLSVVPPLGLIGFASPIAAAGMLFPTLGFVGLALTFCLPALLVNGGKFGFVLTAILVTLVHLVAVPPPRSPADWEAVNTHFGAVGHGQVDWVRDYQVSRSIESQVFQSKAKVLVFPEAVAPGWIEAFLQGNRKTILIGAVKPRSKSSDLRAELSALRGSGDMSTPTTWQRYENKLLVRGGQTGDFAQRVPIPIGMWRPFTETGVPLNLNGPGTIMVAGRCVAVVICYEQLVAWPVLASFLEKPSMIVAVSNNVWVTGTAIPSVERTAMVAWARLFNIPLLLAANT